MPVDPVYNCLLHQASTQLKLPGLFDYSLQTN